MGRSIYGIPCCCQKKEKIKITEMCIPSNGEIVPVDHACPGEIVILADDTLKLNDILGNEKLLPHKTRIDNPMPLLRTTVEPQKPEQREALLNALTEIADTDPLLHFDIDTVTHEIILSFLGKVQLEVICSLLEEKISCGRGYERAFGYLSGKTAKKSELHDSY